jgi:acyl-[acyl-carrier-protein]-phospholipid O-acyltransferase/long-chain-fatty-acid--[acyl-carrier-protein] ligase
MHPQPGSAGKFLPAIEYKLEPVEGIGERRQEEQVQTSGEPKQMTLEASATSNPDSPLEATGRLFVRGPNVMKGYLNLEANAKFHALQGWYDTGDIAKVDANGFVYILGRLKRFAKVSGEMVSLAAIEDCLANAFPQYGPKFGIAVISKPDEAKGEKLIAVTNEPKLKLDQIREAIRSHGLGNLAVPREVKVIRELPRLGTGKINHRELERQALS